MLGMRGHDKGRRDAVGPNVVWSAFGRELPGHGQHSPFRGAVSGGARSRQRHVRVGRGHIDDRAVAALYEVRPSRLDTQEDDVELPRDRPPPVLLVVHLRDGSELHDRRRVDEDIDAAELLGREGHEGLVGGGISEIGQKGLVRQSLAFDEGFGLRGVARVTVAAHQVSTFPGHRQRAPLADPETSGARHHGHLALQSVTHDNTPLVETVVRSETRTVTSIPPSPAFVIGPFLALVLHGRLDGRRPADSPQQRRPTVRPKRERPKACSSTKRSPEAPAGFVGRHRRARRSSKQAIRRRAPRDRGGHRPATTDAHPPPPGRQHRTVSTSDCRTSVYRPPGPGTSDDR